MKKLLLALTAALSLSSAHVAHALQILPGESGKKHVVKIPTSELTRIGIENGRLSGFRYKLDELDVDEDKKTGVVYVQPLVTNKPISVFVQSANGMTHELVLQPTDQMQLESIMIREPISQGQKGSAGGSGSEKAGSLDGAVKRLVLAMARGEGASSDVQVEKLEVPMALWTESKFVLVGKYTSRSLTGEAFKLMNVSSKPMRIAEQELYKPGVVAIVVESQILRPGEETDVFVVRAK
jgi:conjugal transfer pilus assembly protein TraK